MMQPVVNKAELLRFTQDLERLKQTSQADFYYLKQYLNQLSTKQNPKDIPCAEKDS